MALADLRKEYSRQGLSESDLDADPLRQARTWLDAAIAGGVPEPTAMALATATPEGVPSVRMVLLKGIDATGFIFYTNYESRKGHEISANPRAALALYWPVLERQVRVEGIVERLLDAASDAYFASRPRGSQLSTWASAQSSVITSRDALEERVRALEHEYAERAVPRPPYWGGYRVVPHAVEFWQGRPSRLHDRLRYSRRVAGAWGIERLAP